MSRFPILFLGCWCAAVASGCSGDAKGGDDGDSNAAQGGGASGSAGSGGSGGGVVGNSSGSGGSSTTPAVAMYTAAEACDLFAQASCTQAETCGLVLARAANQLVCLQCDALTLGIIKQSCQQDSPSAKDAAAVDRCIASINAQACQQACMSLDVPNCEAFGDLPEGMMMLDCDVRCAQ